MRAGLQVYGQLYVWVAREAFGRAARAWPLALACVTYGVIFGLCALLLMRLGTVGGFLLGLVQAGCITSYFHLLGRAVSGNRLRLDDVKGSLGTFFWDVVGVLFALWIGDLVVGFIARQAGDHAGFVLAAYGLAVAVFLNPIPETIYQGRAPGRTLELLAESWRFIQRHWLEWFIPNLLLGALLLWLLFGREVFDFPTLSLRLPGLFSMQGGYYIGTALLEGSPWTWPLLLGLFHYAMIYRGLLFRELVSGGFRTRAFRSLTR